MKIIAYLTGKGEIMEKYIPSKGEHFKAYLIIRTEYPTKQFGYQPRVFPTKHYGCLARNAEDCICVNVHNNYLEASDNNKDKRIFDFHEFMFERLK